MSKVFNSLRFDDALKTTDGTSFNFHNDLLILGASGFDASSERATIHLGDATHYVEAENAQGLRLRTANEITFETGGSTERMVILSDGKVGMGLAAPATNLQVHNAAGTGQFLLTNDTSGETSGDGLLLELVTTTNEANIINKENAAMKFYTNNTEYMRIAAAGNVGIGTDNPGQTLDVNGDALVRGGDLYLVDTDDKIASDGTDMTFHVGGAQAMVIEDGGNVGVGVADPLVKLHVAGNNTQVAQGYFTQDNATGRAGASIYHTANSGSSTTALELTQDNTGDAFIANRAGILNLSTSGPQNISMSPNDVERLTLTSAPGVGINSTTPVGFMNAVLDQDATTSFLLSNSSAGTAAQAEISVSNDNNEGTRIISFGSNFTTAGAFVQDGGLVGTQPNKSGGLSVAVESSDSGAHMRFYTAGTADGNERMRITQGGNVGIGSTEPTEKLVVAGKTVTTNFQMTTGAQNNYILTSDASGNAVWADASAVSGNSIEDADGNTHIKVENNPDENIIRMTTATVQRIAVGSTGLVAIGDNVTDADQRLDVRGNMVIGDRVAGPGGSATFYLDGASATPAVATQPGIYHRNAVGLGVYSDTAMSFEVDGDNTLTEAMRITNTGLVGVGTVTPATQLHLHNAAGSGQLLVTNDTSGTTSGDGLLLEMITSTNEANIVNKENAAMKFYTNNTEYMRIAAAGNVGVGTDNPDKKLDVNGDLRVRGEDICLGLDDNERISVSGTNMRFYTNNVQQVEIGATGMTIEDDVIVNGNFTVNGDTKTISTETILIEDALLSLGSTNISSDVTDLGFYGTFNDGTLKYSGLIRDASDSGTWKLFVSPTEPGTTQASDLSTFKDLQLGGLIMTTGQTFTGSEMTFTKTNGGSAEVMRLTASGNLGIGTNNPTERLVVDGKTVTTTFQMTTGATNNYVLTSDASGNATWASPQDTTSIQDSDGDTKIQVEEIGDEDVIRFDTAGTERMMIGATGAVGIGTVNATSSLHVAGSIIDTTPDYQGIHMGLDGGAVAMIELASQLATSNSQIDFTTVGSDSRGRIVYDATNNFFALGTVDGSEDMRLDSNGNLGIGTNNPTQKLDVRGNILIEGADGFDAATETATMNLGDVNNYIQAENAQGIRIRTDNELTFETGGSNERMVIESGGYVGIGTLDPAQQLHVYANDSTQAQLCIEQAQGGSPAGIQLSHSTIGGFSTFKVSDAGLTSLQANSGGSLHFGITGVDNDMIWYVGDLVVTQGMRLTHDGKLGVGTQDPESSFHVIGPNLGRVDAPTQPGIHMGENADNNYAVEIMGNGNTTVASLDFGYASGGDFKGQILYQNAAADADGHMSISVGAVERMRITGAGKIGLGVTAPTEELEVAGTIVAHDDVNVGAKTITNTFQMVNGAASNYILASDASGNATWVAPNTASSDKIQDTDTDTRIEVENIADEDVIRMFTAGTERMTVGATGLVGIGSNDPTQTLDVNGDALIQGGNLYLVDTDDKIASDGTNMSLHVGGSERLTILASGNVGINSTTPNRQLDVLGAGQQISVVSTGVAEVSNIEYLTNGDDWELGGRGSSATDHPNSFALYNSSDSQYRLVVDSSGNMGVNLNTTVPTKTLDVNGDIRARGGDVCLSVDDEEKISSNGSVVSIYAENEQRLLVGISAITANTDMVISGNLTVNGATTTVESSVLSVNDPMISLADGNAANTVDIGFYGTYNDGTQKYAGLTRDASDDTWHLFEATDEPTSTVIIASRDNLRLGSAQVDGGIAYDTTMTITSGGIGGTVRATFNASGQLGLGKTPTQALDVLGDALIEGGDLYLVDTDEKIASDGTDMFFHVNGLERMRITSTGKVGLGVTAPTEELEVGGSIVAQDKITTTDFQMTNGASNTYVFTSDASGNASWQPPASTTQLVDADGDTSVQVEASGDEDKIRFNVQGDQKMIIDTNGNVGIGVISSNLDQQLEVNGDAHFNGNVRTVVETLTASTTLDHTHSVVLVDASAGGFQITMPESHDGTAEPNFKGSVFHIIKIDNSANIVTVALSGSDVLDGSAASVQLLSQDDRMTVLNAGGTSNVGRWYTI